MLKDCYPDVEIGVIGVDWGDMIGEENKSVLDYMTSQSSRCFFFQIDLHNDHQGQKDWHQWSNPTVNPEFNSKLHKTVNLLWDWAWINDFIHIQKWDLITHPFPDFNCSITKLPKLLLNFGHVWKITSYGKPWYVIPNPFVYPI